MIDSTRRRLEDSYGDEWEKEMNKWFTRQDFVDFFDIPNHGTKSDLINRIRNYQINRIINNLKMKTKLLIHK